MLLWKQCALPIITTMALWQLMHLGIVHHLPKCMSCRKAIVVITGRAHCFDDNIYICIYIYVYILYLYIHIYINYIYNIYTYICIYIIIYLIIINIIINIYINIYILLIYILLLYILYLWKTAFNKLEKHITSSLTWPILG